MKTLVETQNVLAELAANSQFGWGEHTFDSVTAGSVGIPLGSVAFDPTRHSVYQIDPLAPMGLVLDEDHVGLVLPGRPLVANVIVDQSIRQEHPAVTTAKRGLGDSLIYALDQSMPGITDRTDTYIIGEPDEIARGYEVIEAEDSEALALTISGIARDGLTFVLSDFRHLSFEENSATNVIAVKVNHPAERYIPANVGVVPLGGSREVNTYKPKQLRHVNEELAAEHHRIVTSLQAAGMAVAEVIVKPGAADRYDMAAADLSIADALRQKA